MTNRILPMDVILLLFLIISPLSASADKYEIYFVNSAQIRVGKQLAKVGVIFDEQDEIHWTSEKEAFKARNLRTGRLRVFAQAMMAEKQSKTIAEYFVRTKRLSTRDLFDSTDESEMVSEDTTYYILDELIIDAGEIPEGSFYDEAICVINQDTIIRQLSRSPEGRDLVLPRSLLGGNLSDPIFVDIKRTEVEREWSYYLYKRLYVLPLPLKIE